MGEVDARLLEHLAVLQHRTDAAAPEMLTRFPLPAVLEKFLLAVRFLQGTADRLL